MLQLEPVPASTGPCNTSLQYMFIAFGPGSIWLTCWPHSTLQSKGLLCTVTVALACQQNMNIFQARSCEQKMGYLNNNIWKLFLHDEFLLPFIIANLTCGADAQVHTYCCNKFRSNSESCNPYADEEIPTMDLWTVAELHAF